MTITINYVTDGMTIILSDKRLSEGLKGEYGYTDDNVKLINLRNMGWATGTGLYNFIEPFNRVLSNSYITNIDQIVDIFTDLIKKISNEYPQFKENIDRSIVTFSFLMYNAEKKKPEYVIGLLRRNTEGEQRIQAIPHNQFYLTLPSDYMGDLSYNEIEAFKNFDEANFKSEDIEAIIRKMLLMFEQFTNSKFVSSGCDIGIYRTIRGEARKFILSGEVADLIDRSNKGNIKDLIKELP